MAGKQRADQPVHSNEVMMMSQERGGTKWDIQARDRPANFQAIHQASLVVSENQFGHTDE